MSTVQEQLNLASPTTIADMLRKVAIGDLIAGMVPTAKSRTGLASSTTHTEPEGGVISAVESPAGTALVIVGAGVTPAVGQVAIAYDAEGVATLTFQAAVTAYDVVATTIPSGLGAILAADSGAAT
jgi:hypothetical protein